MPAGERLPSVQGTGILKPSECEKGGKLRGSPGAKPKNAAQEPQRGRAAPFWFINP